MERPRIAVTVGDPAGVGPEVCLRAAADEEVLEACVPILFGSAEVLRACTERLGLLMPEVVESIEEIQDRPAVFDLGGIGIDDFVPGTVSEKTGQASFDWIQGAIDSALAGQVAAVTTGPINKEAIYAAGIRFPGHTEMFAARCDAERSCMMQFSPEITCTFVTTHVGYAEVPGLLTIDRIYQVLELTDRALQRIHNRRPKMVVCGLNPHAGEHGLFGNREEELVIIPAMDRARQAGMDVEGPLPPDTAFLSWRRETTDAFVCMYHDQGHIPVKALAFDSAVNTTLGLPMIRTSVDHGTALDIAWQGKARHSSMVAALKLAAKLSRISASETI